MKKFSICFWRIQAELENFFYPKIIDEKMLKKTRIELKNNNKVRIHLARQKDLEDIMTIQKACYHGKAPWSKTIVRNELKNLYSFFLIAKDEGEGIAFIAAMLRKGHIHITNLGTKPSYQRQGLAEQLIRKVAHIAKELEIKVLTLELRVSNHKAKKLYKKIGFKEAYIKKNYYHDNNEDGLKMIYSIDKEDEEKNERK